MPLKSCYLFLVVIFTCQSYYSNAQEWPLPKGAYFFRLSERWIVSDKHFDSNGQKQSNIVEHGYYSTIIRAEYGLGDRLSASLHFPVINYAYTILPSSQVRQSILNTGDADIGLKYSLSAQRHTAICASLILGLPLGYNENEALSTGDGEFNQLLRLDASQKYMLFKSNGWISIYSGFNHRSHDYADEFLYGLATGVDVSRDKLALVLRLQGIQALGETENAKHVNPLSLFSNLREYFSISPEFIYHFDPAWGVMIGATYLMSGKNTFANTSFEVGLHYKKQEYSIE